jgi:tight adherence protein B
VAAVALVLALPAGADAGSGSGAGTHKATPVTSAAAGTKTTPSAVTSITPKAKTTPAAAKPKVAATPKVAAKPKVTAKPKVAAKPKKPKPKPLPSLTGWGGSGSSFPNESLILSVPRKVQLTSAKIHVSENGLPVTAFSLTPLAKANQGDFGFVVAVDQSPSTTGAPLNDEMSAARLLASRRTAGQALGLVLFGATPSALLPLSTDAGLISTALGSTPPTIPGADASAASTLALDQLFHARDAAGAVAVISDGNGASPQAHASRGAIAAASAAHIPVFTIGLTDQSATASSLGALKQSAPGPFVSATPGTLPQQLGKVYSTASAGYILRYRSRMRPGQAVTVSATVDGTQGAVTAAYTARSPVHHAAAPVHRAPSGPGAANTSPLSPSPSFVAPASPAPAPAPASSFWRSSSSMLVIAGIAALLVGVAIMLILKRPDKRAVRARVGSYAAPVLESGELEEESPGGFPVVMRMLERGNIWPKFVADVEISRNPRTPQQLLKRAMIVGTVLALLLFLVTGTPLYGLLVLMVAPLVLRTWIKRAARKQRELFRELLPMHLQDLAGAMRAGRTVVGALTSVAESADEPIKSELERAIRDEQLGLPLEESLEAIARRMDAEDMDQVALVAALNRRSGSNVAEALDRVAEGARERADLRREVKALTGQAKMSSWVLTGLPPLLLIGISFISPAYAHPMFHTTIGIGLIIVSALMVFTGWKIMNKIINVKV